MDDLGSLGILHWEGAISRNPLWIFDDLLGILDGIGVSVGVEKRHCLSGLGQRFDEDVSKARDGKNHQDR